MENKKTYDCIVVGGGLTGCAAAIAAARQGLTVLLIEESGFLGGAASNSLIYPFMRYRTTAAKGADPADTVLLSRGIFSEIVEELTRRGNGRCFCDEDLKLLLDEKTEEAGVSVLFHTTVCGAEKENGHIRSVTAVMRGTVMTFSGKYFIDCSGDAALCVLAGVPTHIGRESDHGCQAMTLCFRMGNVDKAEFFAHKAETDRKFRAWSEAGKTSNCMDFILVLDHPLEGVLHFNATRIINRNPVDPFALTDAEKEGRRQIREMLRFFREENIPGMEHAQLLFSAPLIGVRESRMLTGCHILTGEELLRCEKFDDAIAAGAYEIDIHNPNGTGTKQIHIPDGNWYTIPYRSLLPQESDADNLLAAGRCLSADHEAQSAVRIMPICCTLGEAAGVGAAAACHAGTSVQNADIRTIQKILIDSGAFIGT